MCISPVIAKRNVKGLFNFNEQIANVILVDTFKFVSVIALLVTRKFTHYFNSPINFFMNIFFWD